MKLCNVKFMVGAVIEIKCLKYVNKNLFLISILEHI